MITNTVSQCNRYTAFSSDGGAVGRNTSSTDSSRLLEAWYLIRYNWDQPLMPSLCVQSKPGGGETLPRLLLIKPDCSWKKILHGLLCYPQPFRAEMISQKIKSSFCPSYNSLIRVFFQLQLIKCLVQYPISLHFLIRLSTSRIMITYFDFEIGFSNCDSFFKCEEHLSRRLRASW